MTGRGGGRTGASSVNRRGAAGFGDRLTLSVEKGVYRGLGLARHEGQVVFLPRAFAGERVSARVTGVERGFLRATVEEILVASPERRVAPCAYADRCGGCTYQDLGYDAQLAQKAAILTETLERAGVTIPEVVSLVPSPEEGWRLRAGLHFQVSRDRLRLGFHREGRHDVIDVEHCLQLSPALNRVARALHRALEGRPSLWPRLRGLQLAEGITRGLVAVLDTDLTPANASLLAPLADAAPELTGWLVGARDGTHEHALLLRGDAHVDHTVLGLSMTCDARVFFQANRHVVEPLVRAVLDLVPAEGEALDLYAGVGLFALPLAARGQSVRAVEIDADAARDAATNLAGLGKAALRIEPGDVLTALRSWAVRGPEQVVLDPPRAGAGPGVVEAVANRHPASIVYVSCDPPTLARDLAQFGRLGYRPGRLLGFDMFPDTFHLETVVRLDPG